MATFFILLQSFMFGANGLPRWASKNINEQAYYRIRGNMTESEVHKLLNCGPGDYRSISRASDRIFDYYGKVSGLRNGKFWISDSGKIGLSFDKNGRVAGQSFSGHGPRFKINPMGNRHIDEE